MSVPPTNDGLVCGEPAIGNPFKRCFPPLMLLSLALACAMPASAAGKKVSFEFVSISFPATRETKAVELAVCKAKGTDPALKARFDAGRAEFDQGILKLNLAKEPTDETIQFFTGQAETWKAIADDPSLPAEVRAAALHNQANCHTVNRDYVKALELATAAAALDPSQKRYAAERDGIRNGFYAKRRGYETATIAAPRLERTGQPEAMTGVASDVAVSSPRVEITPVRTIKQALGAIWFNGRKSYRVEYRERFTLSDAPLFAALKLHNNTERVVDCRGIVVQVSVNGNPVGGPKQLTWEGDPSRVIPKGHITATFPVVQPKTLPAEGTLTVSIFDVPSSVSSTGVIEGKRNDAFTWSIAQGKYSFDAMNKVVEEKITELEAANEGRPIAQAPRYETLGRPND